MTDAVLTEDDVIDHVRDHLVTLGWKITHRSTAVQRGHDLVAQRGREQIFIEAKGAGSSKKGTSRYGREFSKGQVFDHVGKAIMKALRVSAKGDAFAAVALPDNADHRREIDQVKAPLHRIDIGVFWVTADGAVHLDAPWSA